MSVRFFYEWRLPQEDVTAKAREAAKAEDTLGKER